MLVSIDMINIGGNTIYFESIRHILDKHVCINQDNYPDSRDCYAPQVLVIGPFLKYNYPDSRDCYAPQVLVIGPFLKYYLIEKLLDFLLYSVTSFQVSPIQIGMSID
jgi:hypothetical protein